LRCCALHSALVRCHSPEIAYAVLTREISEIVLLGERLSTC